MDKYRDRVPVRTLGSGTRYDGKIWYESLSSICSINGKPTSNVEKSMLSAGDHVTVLFKNKPFQGVVDPTGDFAEADNQGNPVSVTAHPLPAAPPSLDSRDTWGKGSPPALAEQQQKQQEPLQDGQPRQENPLRAQDPTQDGQPCQEKREPTPTQPIMEIDKVGTPTRRSPRKPKLKRPRDRSTTPPKFSVKIKRLVQKKEGEFPLSGVCLHFFIRHVYIFHHYSLRQNTINRLFCTLQSWTIYYKSNPLPTCHKRYMLYVTMGVFYV